MSEKRFAGLSIEQLNAAGAAAGAEAVSRAHSAGLASPGMTNIRLASGEEVKVLTSLHPDGTLEIMDDRIRTFSKKEMPTISMSMNKPTAIGASSVFAMARTSPSKANEGVNVKRSKPTGTGRS
jgi:hypothetical protein